MLRMHNERHDSKKEYTAPATDVLGIRNRSWLIGVRTRLLTSCEFLELQSVCVFGLGTRWIGRRDLSQTGFGGWNSTTTTRRANTHLLLINICPTPIRPPHIAQFVVQGSVEHPKLALGSHFQSSGWFRCAGPSMQIRSTTRKLSHNFKHSGNSSSPVISCSCGCYDEFTREHDSSL